MENTALAIRNKALEFGYEKCGIIKVEEVADYIKKLDERISRIPAGERQYGYLRALAEPGKREDWSKSIVVAVYAYSGFNIPEKYNGIYGKSYMFNGMVDERAPEYISRGKLREYMESLGIRTMDEPKFGLAPLRWAAYKAGLGIIRMNNFFYTENGSYVLIDSWLIDRELEFKEHTELKKCPEKCGKCIKACPSKSLCAPYTMAPALCVSYQTAISARVPTNEMCAQIGDKMYGCDVCQDVCPFNKNKWKGGEDFPGLSELSGKMMPEEIMAMDYEEIRRVLAPKFWYIPKDRLWKWKYNALNAMTNKYCEKYKEAIMLGLDDPDDTVRVFARECCLKLGIPVSQSESAHRAV